MKRPRTTEGADAFEQFVLLGLTIHAVIPLPHSHRLPEDNPKSVLLRLPQPWHPLLVERGCVF
jgi:hypothetical protein